MSEWVEWQRKRWQGKPLPDHLIENDGTFSCVCGCRDLDEHNALKEQLRDNRELFGPDLGNKR